MKSFKIIITLAILYLPFTSFSQDTYAIASSYTVENEINIEDNSTTAEIIKKQEYQLVAQINDALVQKIEYPFAARENGEEGLIRAVVFISSDSSPSSLKIAKGNVESLDAALIAAFEQLNVQELIPQNYEGKKAIPVKINFELD